MTSSKLLVCQDQSEEMGDVQSEVTDVTRN